MLLITRRTGEAIVINGSIEVKVLEIAGGRVKLGFEYPQGSSVFRQELFEKIQAENKAAALSSQEIAAADISSVVGNMVRNLHSGNDGQVGPHTNLNKDANNDATNRNHGPTDNHGRKQ